MGKSLLESAECLVRALVTVVTVVNMDILLMFPPEIPH